MMKVLLAAFALVLTISIPSAFAEIVETKGQNYDLVENFFTGEATWISHPQRIMDGGWQNYALTNNAEKVIFNTNAVGSFVFDKDSCSYSIYGNGYDGQQIIPSVSAVATYLNNGQWQNLPINDEACMVEVSEYEDGVFLTSTKVITEDITEDVFIPYTGTTENFYINATNSQFTLISNSTGNVGYFNGETRVIESVEVEKFVQEIRLDIFDGFKETFKVTHDGSEELGISQTIHSETGIIEIADQVIDIAALNGQSFDRQFIIDNEAEILALTDSINYDFDVGIDSLSNINIIFDGDYKVNMDFAQGGFVGYLEIDPTFTVTSGNDGWFRDSNGDNVCSSANSFSQTAVLEPHIYGSPSSHIDCQVAYIEFPVSGFPSTATVTDVELDFYVMSVLSPDACDVRPITTNQPSVSGSQTIFNEIMGATDYTQLTECQSTGQKSNMNLGSQAVTDFNNSITSGWFALGLKQDTDTVNANKITTIASSSHSTYDPPKLTVTYSFPTVANAPTNLSTVTGVPIELDWDVPSSDGGSSITGYKVFRTDNQYSYSELPDNSANSAGIDFTNSEFLIHGFESQSTLTYEDDFSTNKGWTTSGSGAPTCTIDLTTDERAEFSMASGSWTAPHCKDDLGLTLDDENFVLRFAVDIYSWTSVGNNANIKIWLDDDGNTGGDAIGVSFNMNNLGANYDGIYAFANDGSAGTQSGSAHNGVTPINPANVGAQGYTAYMEIIRTSANSITVTEYSDSNYSTVVSTGTLSGGDLNVYGSGSWSNNQSQMTGVTGLSYLMFGLSNNDSQGGTWNMSLDDIEIYNGVTSTDDVSTLPDKSTNNISITADKTILGTDAINVVTGTLTSDTSNGLGWHYDGSTATSLDMDMSTDFTLGYQWMRDSDQDGSNIDTGFYAKASGASTPYLYHYTDSNGSTSTSNHYWAVGVDGGGCGASSADRQWATNQWYNFVITKSGSSFELFVDGTSMCTWSGFSGTATNMVAGIGVNHNLSSYKHSGGLDEFFFVDRVLTQSEIDAYVDGTAPSNTVFYNSMNNPSQLNHESILSTSSTTGVIGTGIEPVLSFHDENLPDGIDDFSIGSWVKLDGTETGNLAYDSDVAWRTDGTDVTVTGNTVQSTATGGVWGYVTSTTTLERGTAVKYTCDVSPLNGNAYPYVKLGLKDTSTNEPNFSSDYDVYCDNNADLKYYDGSSLLQTNNVAWSSSDVMKLEITDSGNVNHYKNDVLQYTFPSTAGTQDYYITTTLYGASGYGQGQVVDVEKLTPELTYQGKLLGINDVTFNVNPTSASVDELVTTTTGGITTQGVWGNTASETIEDFTTWSSTTGGSNYWSGSGNSNISIDTGADRYKIYQTTNGQYMNSQYVFGTGSNGIPNDDADWKLRMKIGGSWSYANTGSNPYDNSWQFHIQNSAGTNKLGHIFELVPHQLQGVGGFGADLKSTAGNEHRKLLTPNYKPSSGSTFWVEYDVSKSTSTATISIWTSSGYSGTPNYQWTYTGAKVDALTGIDRVKVQDNSWNGYGSYSMWFDDIELIVDTTSTVTTNNQIISGTIPDTTTEPRHVVFSRSGSDWTIYSQGSSVATATDSVNLGSSGGVQTTITDNFSSNNGWSSSDTSKLDIASGALQIYSGTGVHHIAKDLTGGSEIVGDFTIQYEATYTTLGSTSLGIQYHGVSDSQANAQTAQDELFLLIYDGANNFQSGTTNDGRPDQSSNQGVLSPTPNPTTTTYYIELKRSGSNWITNIYSDSGFSNLIGTRTVSDSSPTGLRYFTVQTYSTGNYVGSIDNFSFTYTTPTSDYTTHIDGMIDEFFISSEAYDSSEVDMIYEKGIAPTQIATTNAATTEYDDQNVVGGNEYFYSLKSTNAIGDSDFLTPFVSALAGTPPNAPVISTAINNPNTAPLDITVSISPDANVGTGTLSGFEIYRDGTLITTTGLVSTYVDTVPSGGGSFEYSAKSVSNHGTSVLSNLSSITTPSVPDAPSLTLSINNPNSNPLDITATFVAPSNSGGSAVTSYNLLHSTDDVTYTTVATNVTPDSTYTVSAAGLHYFKAQANNLIGSSLESAAVSINTPSVPDAPATVNTSIGNPNANPLDIVVGWSASPNDQGSAITAYKVYRSSDDVTYSVIATLGNSVYSYADTVPQSGSYYYKISSVNNVGEGLQSAYSLINTPTVPDAPVLTSGAINSSQIDSTWTTPSNGNSAIISYEISVDGTVTDLGLVNANSQTGLTQNTAYEIKVRAVNNVGNSAWSNAITSTTNTPPSGTNTIALNNSWGDVVIVDSTITVSGNPTPTLDKIEFVLDSNIVSTVNNPTLTGTYAITLPDTNQHGLLLRVTASNGDSTYWDSNSITVTGATVTRVDAAEGDNTVAYSIARTPHPTNDALDEIELKWAKDSFPFDGSCTFMSPSQALEVRDLNNLPSNLSFNDQSSVNVYDTTVNISEKNNAYVYCWSGDDLQFAAQSEALGSNALLSGLSGLDSGLGTTVVDPETGAETSYSILGAPMIVIFVLLIAGQATGRTAPTFIIIILAAVGILMGLGFFMIDEGIFGLILIMGAMGVMIGKKFL